MRDARGDVKRLNAVMPEFFQGVELATIAGGIRIAPLLSAYAADPIMRGLPWRHGVTVDGAASEVLGVDNEGRTWLTLPAGVRPGDDRVIEIPDPPAVTAMPQQIANPHTPT